MKIVLNTGQQSKVGHKVISRLSGHPRVCLKTQARLLDFEKGWCGGSQGPLSQKHLKFISFLRKPLCFLREWVPACQLEGCIKNSQYSIKNIASGFRYVEFFFFTMRHVCFCIKGVILKSGSQHHQTYAQMGTPKPRVKIPQGQISSRCKLPSHNVLFLSSIFQQTFYYENM